MSVFLCVDIMEHIFSYIDMLPHFPSVNSEWRNTFHSILDRKVEYINSAFPSWKEDGIIALNMMALDNRWDLFQMVLHMNKNILIDDAMRLTFLFQKESMIDKIFSLYSPSGSRYKNRKGSIERVSYSPMYVWYLWIKNIQGKEEALHNMMNMLQYHSDESFYGYVTQDIITYIKQRYGITTVDNGIAGGNYRRIQYKGMVRSFHHEIVEELCLKETYLLPNIIYLTPKVIKERKRYIINDALSVPDDNRICASIYRSRHPHPPIIYSVEDIKPILLYLKSNHLSGIGIAPIYTGSLHKYTTETICQAATKRGPRCKNRAIHFIGDNVKKCVCLIHVKEYY